MLRGAAVAGRRREAWAVLGRDGPVAPGDRSSANGLGLRDRDTLRPNMMDCGKRCGHVANDSPATPQHSYVLSPPVFFQALTSVVVPDALASRAASSPVLDR